MTWASQGHQQPLLAGDHDHLHRAAHPINDGRGPPSAASDCRRGAHARLDTVAPFHHLRTVKSITLTATFDGEHIRLEDDFPIPKNARLLVTVLPGDADDDRAFRDFWQKVSSQSLARTYGPDEPHYTLAMVKEPNPEYEGR